MAGPDAETLNIGLDLAMAWGPDWLKPIQARLAERLPSLSTPELDRCEKVCREAMRRGHDLVGELIAMTGSPSESVLHQFAAQMLTRWPWISHENLNRLYSQGCYYAMK